jgi:hypothetical protein
MAEFWDSRILDIREVIEFEICFLGSFQEYFNFKHIAHA